jgi:hypothetical protein
MYFSVLIVWIVILEWFSQILLGFSPSFDHESLIISLYSFLAALILVCQSPFYDKAAMSNVYDWIWKSVAEENNWDLYRVVAWVGMMRVCVAALTVSLRVARGYRCLFLLRRQSSAHKSIGTTKS